MKHSVRERGVNHENHENIMPRKFGAIRYLVVLRKWFAAEREVNLLLISFCSRATARKNERQVYRISVLGRGVACSELYSRSSKQFIRHVIW